jgi:excisionase family DNA binding protein
MDYLTVKEAAEHLRVSEATIRRLVREGMLPSFKVGRQFRIADGSLKTLFFVKGKTK